jgi:two-component system sensor histidine kinase DegS
MVIDAESADLAAAPIWNRDWVAGVVVAVYADLGPPNRYDLRALTTVAVRAGVALEGNDLVAALTPTEQSLTSVIRTTIEAQEEERRRVAAEIHDGVTQQLIGIWYRVQACERLLDRDVALAREELAAVKARLDEALMETRVAIYNLRPSTLDDLGLVPTLNTLINDFATESQIRAELRVQGDVRLPEHFETGLYRIVQEALTNVKKHSGASEVAVSIALEGRSVKLVIRDNGCGFSATRVRRLDQRQASFGLTGMNERAKLLGGMLRVETGDGRGTTITVRVPLDERGA